MPSPVEPGVQAEIDRRRKVGERRFVEVARGLSAPAFVHHGLTESEIKRRFERGGPGLLAVSLHFHAYFLLLLALDKVGIPCTAITTEQLAQRLRASGYRPGSDLRFETRLTPRLLRECRAGERILFVMVDVLTDRGPNMMVPVFGRAKVYTVSWAQLAIRLEADVLVAVCQDRGSVADIHTEILDGPFQDAFTLAARVFERFDRILGDDLSTWEDQPAWSRYSAPLPDFASGSDAELIQAIHRLAACDEVIAKRLLALVRQGWPQFAPGARPVLKPRTSRPAPAAGLG